MEASTLVCCCIWYTKYFWIVYHRIKSKMSWLMRTACKVLSPSWRLTWRLQSLSQEGCPWRRNATPTLTLHTNWIVPIAHGHFHGLAPLTDTCWHIQVRGVLLIWLYVPSNLFQPIRGGRSGWMGTYVITLAYWNWPPKLWDIKVSKTLSLMFR